MEQTLIVIGSIFAVAIYVILLVKYFRGDFDYKDEILFYDKIKQECIIKRTFHSGKIEIIRKQYK